MILITFKFNQFFPVLRHLFIPIVIKTARKFLVIVLINKIKWGENITNLWQGSDSDTKQYITRFGKKRSGTVLAGDRFH